MYIRAYVHAYMYVCVSMRVNVCVWMRVGATTRQGKYQCTYVGVLAYVCTVYSSSLYSVRGMLVRRTVYVYASYIVRVYVVLCTRVRGTLYVRI